MAQYASGQTADLSGRRSPYKYAPAKITKYIGSGNNAKHSIATIVLISCFCVGVIVSIFVIVNYWCFRDCENKVPDIVSDLRVIWEIVTPIITLVLGYEFGKFEK